jgi:hypothetical protein
MVEIFFTCVVHALLFYDGTPASLVSLFSVSATLSVYTVELGYNVIEVT